MELPAVQAELRAETFNLGKRRALLFGFSLDVWMRAVLPSPALPVRITRPVPPFQNGGRQLLVELGGGRRFSSQVCFQATGEAVAGIRLAVELEELSR